VNAVTGVATEYPPDQCTKMRRTGLIILSEDWKIIRKILQINCQFDQCKQMTGRFDALFLILDDAAKKVPLP